MHTRLRLVGPLILGVLVVPAVSVGLNRSHGQDDEDPALVKRMARQLFENHCLSCHGAELVENQRLTPKQWSAEVEKMNNWGAAVPADRVDELTAYLTAEFPTNARKNVPARLSPEEVRRETERFSTPSPLANADPERGAGFFKESCANCHGADGRGSDLGPALANMPVLLRAEEFRDVTIRGRRRMPSFTLVLDEPKTQDILGWLRGL